MKTLPKWITIPEAAERLNVSTQTIRRRITDGTIEGKRFGPRLIRVNGDNLGEYGQPLQYVDPEAPELSPAEIRVKELEQMLLDMKKAAPNTDERRVRIAANPEHR